MIICETHDQIMDTINGASADQYAAMKPALLRAKNQAIKVRDYQVLAAQIIQSGA
jgi:hypothetical protein